MTITATSKTTYTETRDGRKFTVTVLPPVQPPKNRSTKTRYQFRDVERPGDGLQ